MSTTQSRWLSPDPYNGSYDITNPQSFNRYSYVANNPMAFIDPSGLTSLGGCYLEYLLGIHDSTCGDGGAGGSGGTGGAYGGYAGGYSGAGASPSGEGGGGYSGGGGGAGSGSADGILGYAPNNGEPPSPCLVANIAAVNQVSNLNVNMNNVVGQPFIYNGGLDVNFSVPGASPSQLPAGRYPSSFLNRIFGIGSSLHVPGPGGPDPSTYGMSNGNFTFTTHIDSAYSTWYTPLGALIHFFVDVRDHGAHRGPC